MNNEEKPKSGLGTAGLILGIIGVCTSFIPFVNNLSFVMGVLAIIFGIIALVKTKRPVKHIIVIVLGIIAIMATISSQETLSDAIDEAVDDLDESFSDMSGENTDDILANYVNVEIGTLEVTEGTYITETELPVTVTNISDETKSYSITVEAVDSSGNRLDTDYIYVNDLSAGQSQTFEIFTYIADDDLTDMKNATFNIVEVEMY